MDTRQFEEALEYTGMEAQIDIRQRQRWPFIFEPVLVGDGWEMYTGIIGELCVPGGIRVIFPRYSTCVVGTDIYSALVEVRRLTCSEILIEGKPKLFKLLYRLILRTSWLKRLTISTIQLFTKLASALFPH